MGHIFLSGLFYNIILIILYRHYKRGEKYIKTKDLVFYTILLIVFGTWGSGEGDYLHYKERVETFNTLFDVTSVTGMEVQYNYLSYLVNGNYTLWRLVIFTIQFAGMSWFLYKAKLNTYPVYTSFVAICLLMYTYQRSYWGIIFYFMGLFLLIERKNPLYIIPIILCYFAHTQNVIVLLFLPFAFIDIKRWHIASMIAFFGVITSLFRDLFVSILNSGSNADSRYFNEKASLYGESNGNYLGGSIGENVLFILRYLPVIILAISWGYMILKDRKTYMACLKPYRSFINTVLGLVTLALLFFLSSLGSSLFVYRILSMTLFPIAILLPYFAENDRKKMESFTKYLWVYIVCSEISCIKDFYYAYMGGGF